MIWEKRTFSAEPLDLEDEQYGDENESVFICNFCDVALTGNMDVMLTHCNVCTARPRPSLSFKYLCFVCEYNTYYRESMRKHIRTHLGAKPFKCYMCDYSAAQKSTLKRHIIRHKGENPFSCSLCDFVSKRCYMLTKHIKDKHGDWSTTVDM
uniref:RE1-silencing transcription factor n=2 Tax=Cacopsylla melanoneura TaxID=428564 RepID=A0A8D8M3N8_9HEMI